MPLFTKAKVIDEKRLGIRYFDEALTNASRATLIHDAMDIYRNNPGVWAPGWPNFDWALGNAVRSYIRRQGDVPMTFNADEVLTGRELAYIGQRLGIEGPYRPTWQRAEPKVPGKPRVRQPKPVPKPVPTLWARLLED